ncbi:MAG: hypothetical protein HY608_05160 [Planctomycetes bacterium]|nr:hypothetical protein [Planctomycetota bacterium]
MARLLFWLSFVFWAGMTAWLVERDILAPRRSSSDPRYYRDRFEGRTFPMRATYELAVGGSAVGNAVVSGSRAGSGAVTWTTEMSLDLVSLVRTQAPALSRAAQDAPAANLRIEVFLTPRMVFEQARLHVEAGPFRERFRILPVGDRLTVRGGETMRSLAGTDTLSVPFDPRAVLDIGVLPLDTGGGLAVGQSWTCHTLDPLRLRIEPVQVTVVERRAREIWAGGIAGTAFDLRWGRADDPMAPRTVVDGEGRVLRHEHGPMMIELLSYEEGAAAEVLPPVAEEPD